VFRVRIAYEHEAVARGALAFGVELVGALVRGEPAPDAEKAARGLRGR
jgi:hypothetical protein